MEVTQLLANWRPVHHTVNDSGEDYDLYCVGTGGVTKITEVAMTSPLNRCGRLFYDVDYDGKKSIRVFNPNCVRYEVK